MRLKLLENVVKGVLAFAGCGDSTTSDESQDERQVSSKTKSQQEESSEEKRDALELTRESLEETDDKDGDEGTEEAEYSLPEMMTEAEFEKWAEKMSEDDLVFFKMFYRKYDINKPGKNDDDEELKAKYPQYETEVIYVLRGRGELKSVYKEKLYEIFTNVGYYEENK